VGLTAPHTQLEAPIHNFSEVKRLWLIAAFVGWRCAKLQGLSLIANTEIPITAYLLYTAACNMMIMLLFGKALEGLTLNLGI